MTDRATLKTFFQTGDFPTQVQFALWLDSIPIWEKTNILFEAFQPSAASSTTITLFSGVAGTTPTAVKIKHSTSFTGGTISAASIRILVAGVSTILATFDVFQAPGASVGILNAITLPVGIPSLVSTSNYSITLTLAGGVINDLVAGDVDVWILEGPVV